MGVEPSSPAGPTFVYVGHLGKGLKSSAYHDLQTDPKTGGVHGDPLQDFSAKQEITGGGVPSGADELSQENRCHADRLAPEGKQQQIY